MQGRPSNKRTRLAELREWHGLTQQQLAAATGIPLATYRRLEGGEIANPRIRHLVNCSVALDCRLEEICEPEWLVWSGFDPKAARPPDPERFLPRRRRPPGSSG